MIRPSDDSAILTYRLELHTPSGQVAAYATSVWARRDGQWKTVFQQATAIP